ncbi:MAG: hypothetical protein CMC13_09155 [Flavobacteriaceae bacterium]|jgi:hypothetical protein|nr:hypothetical protein [Flavobacteriaceae bacterium]
MKKILHAEIALKTTIRSWPRKTFLLNFGRTNHQHNPQLVDVNTLTQNCADKKNQPLLNKAIVFNVLKLVNRIILLPKLPSYCISDHLVSNQ